MVTGTDFRTAMEKLMDARTRVQQETVGLRERRLIDVDEEALASGEMTPVDTSTTLEDGNAGADFPSSPAVGP